MVGEREKRRAIGERESGYGEKEKAEERVFFYLEKPNSNKDKKRTQNSHFSFDVKVMGIKTISTTITTIWMTCGKVLNC